MWRLEFCSCFLRLLPVRRRLVPNSELSFVHGADKVMATRKAITSTSIYTRGSFVDSVAPGEAQYEPLLLEQDLNILFLAGII